MGSIPASRLTFWRLRMRRTEIISMMIFFALCMVGCQNSDNNTTTTRNISRIIMMRDDPYHYLAMVQAEEKKVELLYFAVYNLPLIFCDVQSSEKEWIKYCNGSLLEIHIHNVYSIEPNNRKKDDNQE